MKDEWTPVNHTDRLRDALSKLLIGQPEAVDVIPPLVQLFRTGIAPEGRPAGVVMLMGPTGTGKTHTPEALAEVLHGDKRCVLRIDCGEFQLEHEVAKLIGAPPGYLGHRETTPMLNQHKLNAVASDRCNLSIAVFDEVEKAASSMQRLLLGVLDKGVLKLGDNTTVNFERSLIFLTSNLGAREIHAAATTGGVGFQREPAKENVFHPIAMRALRKHFSPEFVNRIDRVVVYRELTRADLRKILQQHVINLRQHLDRRLGPKSFDVALTKGAEDYLLDLGTSPGSGARELKRALHREVLEKLADEIHTGAAGVGARCTVRRGGDGLTLSWDAVKATTA